MAINFPASPSTNDTHTENAITWIFNGTSWDAQGDQVTAASIGLGSVDNTSDADKPVSTAQQTALDLKADLRAVTAKVASYSIADGDSGEIHEIITSSVVQITLDDAITQGTIVDIVLKGSGIVEFLASGSAVISGSTRLYLAGSNAIVYKKSSTDWVVVSAWSGYAATTLEYCYTHGISNIYRIQKLDSIVRMISGETESSGWDKADWDTWASNKFLSLLFGASFRRALNIGTGATVEDISGNDNDMALLGSPSWGVDGFDLNGSTQYGAITDGASLQPTSGTVMISFVATSGSSGFVALVSKNSTSASEGWYIALNNGVPRVYIKESGGNVKQLDLATEDLRDDLPHSLGFTFTQDGSDGTLTMYLDGVAQSPTVTTNDAITDLPAASGEPIRVGRQGNGSADWHDKVESFWMLNTDLSATEMEGLHTICTGP